MRYIPHTEDDVRRMLEVIGVPSVDALFETIPAAERLGRPLEVPSAMSERDLLRHMDELSKRNVAGDGTLSFLGGGVYRHLRPVAEDQLLLRGELYTAYTPYQPEVSQGTLQIIFEFQTMVAELLGADAVNASMYDGATATAEALLMAARVTGRERLLVSETLHPEYRAVAESYVHGLGPLVETVPRTDAGTVDLAWAAARLARKDDPVACLAVGYPNFYGGLDDVAKAAEICRDAGAQLVVVFQEALAFGLLTPPGALGADIVAGEGQSLGVAPSFGGPHLGLFGCRERDVRKMPGRLAGETVDSRGNRGFVLTLATREQHIRREKATSNICTNTGLNATAATIFMALLGPRGLAAVSRACHLRAEETKRALLALPGFSLRFPGPTFHEFVLRCPVPAADVVRALAEEAIAPGIDLGRFDPTLADSLLVCATELTTQDDVRRLAAALARFGR